MLSNNVSAGKALEMLALFHAVVIVAKVIAVKRSLDDPATNRNPQNFIVLHVPAARQSATWHGTQPLLELHSLVDPVQNVKPAIQAHA